MVIITKFYYTQRFGIYDVALAIWVEQSGTVYTVLCDVPNFLMLDKIFINIKTR